MKAFLLPLILVLAVAGSARAENEGAVSDDAGCAATWLVPAQPGEFAVQLGPWAVLLVARAHGQETMTLEVKADPSVPVTFVHSSQPEGEALLLSVDSTRPVTVTATATREQDCATAVVHFPVED